MELTGIKAIFWLWDKKTVGKSVETVDNFMHRLGVENSFPAENCNFSTKSACMANCTKRLSGGAMSTTNKKGRNLYLV